VNTDSSSPAQSSPTTQRLDAEIVRRAQAGDADAFAALFNAHKARIYSLCLRMTNNTAEAEDLTQDAFLQVFRKLSSFRGDSALSTWLHRIAVNTVLMRFRKKALAQVSLDEPRSKNGDGKPMLTRAIAELPEGYRTVFLLHEVEGYEHREIAEFLGCSTGNSKSQLHKAKMRIRELLLAGPAERTQEAVSSESMRRDASRITVSPLQDWEVAVDAPVARTVIPTRLAQANG